MKLYNGGDGVHIGLTDLSKYVTSSHRERDEDALRRGLAESAAKATPAAAVQEIRLALTEILLGQGKIEEATKFMAEATSLRDLNAGGDVGQLFWMAELEWRAGNANASFALLREALDLADSDQTLPGLVDGTPNELCGLSKLCILHTPFLRLNMMGRKHETAETMARTARLVAARGTRNHLCSTSPALILDSILTPGSVRWQ